MNEFHTSLPTRSYLVRRFLSLTLLLMSLYGMYLGLTTGCIKFSRTGIVDCQATNPLGYWSSILILFIVIISLFMLFISSFGQVTDEVHHREEKKLDDWLDKTKPHTTPLMQMARMPTTARFLLISAVVFAFFILFLYGKSTKDVGQVIVLTILLFLLILVVTLIAEWLAKEIEINTQGIRVFIIWRGWKQWSWKDIAQIDMKGDYVDKSYRLILYSPKGRLTFSPSSFHQDKDKFLEASQWILQEAVRHKTNVQLPVDGLEEWLSGIAEK